MASAASALSPNGIVSLTTYKNLAVTVDIGTLATRVVLMERGARHPVLVRNDLANEWTPTVVAFPVDSEVKVGDVAQPLTQSRPLQAVTCLPSLLGLDFSDVAACEALAKALILPNPLNAEGVDVPSFAQYGAPFSPTFLVVLLLNRCIGFVRRHIRERYRPETSADADSFEAALEAALPSRLTIVLPRAAPERAFRSASLAAQLVGFPANAVSVLTDTQAAVAAFAALRGIQIGSETPVGARTRVVLVNVGSHYSSVAVVDVSGPVKEGAEPSQPCVHFLADSGIEAGSFDIDAAMYADVLEVALAQAKDGIPTRGRARILDQCRKAKVILSTSPSALISAEAVSADGNLDVRQNVTSDQLLRYSAPLVAKVSALVGDALAAAASASGDDFEKLGDDENSPAGKPTTRVEVIGGGWRNPQLRKALGDVSTSGTVCTTLDAATTAVLGGAYLSGMARVSDENAVFRLRAVERLSSQLESAASHEAAMQAAVTAAEASVAAAEAAAAAPAECEAASDAAAALVKALQDAKTVKEAAVLAAASAAAARAQAEASLGSAQAAVAAGPSLEEAFWSSLAAPSGAAGTALTSVVSDEERASHANMWSRLTARDTEYVELATAQNALDEELGNQHLKLCGTRYRSNMPPDELVKFEDAVKSTRTWLDEEEPHADNDQRLEKLLPTGRLAVSFRERLAILKKTIAEECPSVAVVDAEIQKEKDEEDAQLKVEADKAAQHQRKPQSDPERLKVAALRRDQGNDLFKKGDHMPEAAQRYTEALKILNDVYDTSGPHKEERNALLISCHLNLASIAVTQQQWKDAVSNANKVLELKPDHPKAYFRKGQGHLGLGDYDESEASLSKAAELCPSDAAIERARAELAQKHAAFKKKQKGMASRMFGALG